MTVKCDNCVHRDGFIKNGHNMYYCELTLIMIDNIYFGQDRCPLSESEYKLRNIETEW